MHQWEDYILDRQKYFRSSNSGLQICSLCGRTYAFPSVWMNLHLFQKHHIPLKDTPIRTKGGETVLSIRENSHKYWDEHSIRTLIQLLQEGVKPRKIAEILQRSTQGIWAVSYIAKKALQLETPEQIREYVKERPVGEHWADALINLKFNSQLEQPAQVTEPRAAAQVDSDASFDFYLKKLDALLDGVREIIAQTIAAGVKEGMTKKAEEYEKRITDLEEVVSYAKKRNLVDMVNKELRG